MRISFSRHASTAAAASQRGAVMFLLAAVMLVVLLGGALAVDLSIVATRGQSLQNAADAASLAGVQAYRASGGDQTIAQEAVTTMLEQNGIAAGGDITVIVGFPDDLNQTEVTVTVIDTEPGTLLGGITGVDSDVERVATARFDSCEASCTINVVIPSPFRSVNAEGTGDGYKPIPVGHELYALNHNSSYGAIVCVDRHTADDPIIKGRCNGWTSTSKEAYATGANTVRNPEMPLTAVYGTKIYWTAADSAGTKLFCFETATGTPCLAAYLINNRDRASSSEISNSKDRNRGGGTVLVGDRIFAFTDDHRVHCFIPDSGLGVQPCAGYESNGQQSFLAADGFPANDPADGNAGSSIDRIVDEVNGKVYWTIHVPNGPAPPADCSQSNDQFPSGLVSIQNESTGRFITRNGNNITDESDNDDDDSKWWVIPAGTDSSGYPRYYLQSATDEDKYIDADNGGERQLDITDSSNPQNDDRWSIYYEGSTSRIRSDYGSYIYWDTNDDDFRTDWSPSRDDFIIRDADCFDPGYVPPSTTTAVVHTGGTWLQCWDTVYNQSCSGFTPSAIHTDGSRFSGRLFFHMDGAATPAVQGVCSSGFAGSVTSANFEINCVSNSSGALDATLTTDVLPMRNAIAGVTDSSPSAWGDPHYNEDSNRIFYPTAHDQSRVVCWDFDYGMCGVLRQSSSLGWIDDYGFFSEGDCVYGLGHNAYFYAFQAEDIYSECTGSTTRTHIEPCDCSGDWKWGTLTFDVDLALFDEFYVQIENSSGDIVYPVPDPLYPDDPGHSLHTNGLTIDLNPLPVSSDPTNDYLEILVSVKSDSDPWAQGEQTFSVEFARAPRLID